MKITMTVTLDVSHVQGAEHLGPMWARVCAYDAVSKGLHRGDLSHEDSKMVKLCVVSIDHSSDLPTIG